MPRYYFNLSGVDEDDVGVDYPDVRSARNAAVSFLGAYLRDDPAYAYDGHWRVDVTDEQRRPLLHVIVATVDAPPLRTDG